MFKVIYFIKSNTNVSYFGTCELYSIISVGLFINSFETDKVTDPEMSGAFSKVLFKKTAVGSNFVLIEIFGVFVP